MLQQYFEKFNCTITAENDQVEPGTRGATTNTAPSPPMPRKSRTFHYIYAAVQVSFHQNPTIKRVTYQLESTASDPLSPTPLGWGSEVCSGNYLALGALCFWAYDSDISGLGGPQGCAESWDKESWGQEASSK
ncbi:hypothetical protein Hamer_G018754, partial [Homarus americanus]